jgi:hypothetical protein
MVRYAGSTVEKDYNEGHSVTRTLEDTLVAAIQRAPCQPLAKLALADLLEERGNSLEATALRWCAETALGLALRQLEEESNANCKNEDGTLSAVGRSL